MDLDALFDEFDPQRSGKVAYAQLVRTRVKGVITASSLEALPPLPASIAAQTSEDRPPNAEDGEWPLATLPPSARYCCADVRTRAREPLSRDACAPAVGYLP